jgi:hypothetical protein
MEASHYNAANFMLKNFDIMSIQPEFRAQQLISKHSLLKSITNRSRCNTPQRLSDFFN